MILYVGCGKETAALTDCIYQAYAKESDPERRMLLKKLLMRALNCDNLQGQKKTASKKLTATQ